MTAMSYFIFKKRLVFGIFVIIIGSYKFPQKILSSTTVFNIDNNKKYFLSSKTKY